MSSTATSGRRYRLKGRRVVVTGCFKNRSRLDVEVLVIQHGCHLRRDINEQTSFIVAGSRPGVAKMKKAKQLKIPVYTLNDFLKNDFLNQIL